ncbi:NCA2-domain-containing protein [Violaceomyces palustris]|uniref:NCA2-domain-containing protein n=1 Tax=Violaceomyces palustris TaxID=1673888 RepID=A0ACD0P2B8_9BASI|nr:NCA2-domain-containing protein [Violaceomyces palustris]
MTSTSARRLSTSSSSPSSSTSSFAVDSLSRLGTQLESLESELFTLEETQTCGREEEEEGEEGQGEDGGKTEEVFKDDGKDFGITVSESPSSKISSKVDARRSASLKAFRHVGSTIDLVNPLSVPSAESLLGLLDSLEVPRDRTSDLSAQVESPLEDEEVEALRIAALARITYASYSLVLDSLLKDAGELGDEAWYWTEVEESSFKSAYFLVQTFPLRLANLFKATAELLSENAAASIRGEKGRGGAYGHGPFSIFFSKENLVRAWRLMLNTPHLVTGALFPFSTQVLNTTDILQTTRQIAKGKKKVSRRASLRDSMVSFSPLHLTKHEARHKRKALLRERDALAEKLGALAQVQSRPSSSQKPKDEQPILQLLRKGLADDLVLKLGEISTALQYNELGQDPVTSSSVNVEIDSGSSSSSISASLRAILTHSLPCQQSHTRSLLSPSALGQPHPFTQRWPSLVFYPIAGWVIARQLSKNWDGIIAQANEAKETVRGFLVGWVWEPCVQLLETVRHGEEGSVIISRESLNSDLKSLERMVSTFASEKYGISGPELDQVAAKVREGDLTHVLKIYEDEMRSPLKSALTGSLLRSLLIQIQKAKVDLEVAMSGIDKLLKSQQLLFGAVGIAPALGILYVTGSWLRNRLAELGGRRSKKTGEGTKVRTWEAMRRIDQLLSKPVAWSASKSTLASAASSSPSSLPPLTHGLLLLDLSLLRSSSGELLLSAAKGNKSLAKRLQRQFLDDVRELEVGGAASLLDEEPGVQSSGPQAPVSGVGIGYWSRRATVERMWRSWGGVFSLGF